ncbi:MAG: DNA-methyltransferase, partial [Planctomycetota bacterium]
SPSREDHQSPGVTLPEIWSFNDAGAPTVGEAEPSSAADHGNSESESGSQSSDKPAHWLILGDFRDVLPKAVAPGSIDFAYLDPPFGVGKTHRSRRSGALSRSNRAEADAGSAAPSAPMPRREFQWHDSSDPITLIELLDDAIQLIRPLIRPKSGVIAIHTDHRASPWVRGLLDEHFGSQHFINELIWKYGLGNATSKRFFLRKHDTIAVYGISNEYYFNQLRGPLTPAQEKKYCHEDEQGRYMLSYGKKYYLKGGKPLESVLEVPALGATEGERCGYPTQKPIRLLDVLIRAFCPPGGTVLDCCCGSGTTGLAAMQAGAGRRWIMIDRERDAIETVRARLSQRQSSSMPQA